VRLIGVFILVFFLMISVQAGTDHETPSEYQVKAAFIYNFAKFVDWPDSADIKNADTMTIGIMGKNPFEDILDQIAASKTVNGHAIKVIYSDDRSDLDKCHIVFIANDKKDIDKQVLEHLHLNGVLSVSDCQGFANHGGIIGFVTIEGKVKFEINKAAADRAHLHLSSKLLKLAINTIGNGD